ncbi:hypothetical protein P43SY_003716 [Pythium insidiosum]|uniref:HTH CENPB-type domain-containing protein n=1 Tax=Pythium insidiosum TaxID=114742 RepID=A0AAD5M6W0_PYTIN|nr:hypothetical protein P43SY_003716 [Pythium insidiosum]
MNVVPTGETPLAVAPLDHADGAIDNTAAADEGEASAVRPDDPVADSAVKTSTAKARRTTLSLHEKSIAKAFCEERIAECKARNETAPSQDVLRQEITAKFGWEVGRSTLSKIMSMEWQQLDVSTHPNPNMKRKRKPLFPAFEEDLVKSVRAHIARQDAVLAAATAASLEVSVLEPSGAPADSSVIGDSVARETPLLTEAVILEEAQRLKQQHGIKDEELVLSVGWLDRFKQRNGIRLRKAAAAGRANAGAAGTGNAMGLSLSWAGPLKRRRGGTTDDAGARGVLWTQWPTSTTGLSLDCTLSRASTLCSSPLNPGPRLWPDRLDMLRSKLPGSVQSLCCPSCAPMVPAGIEGLHVILMGYECVRDAFLVAAAVGSHGSVTCFEAQESAVAIASACVNDFTTKTLGYLACNLKIASLSTVSTAGPLKTADLVMINCAFQVTATKTPLLRAAFNLLREGGECVVTYGATARRYLFALSGNDSDPALSTIMYEEDFRRMCQHVGFLDPRWVHEERRVLYHGPPSHGQHQPLDRNDGTTTSTEMQPIDVGVRTCRLFKIHTLEDRAENYGEHALYLGGLGDGVTPDDAYSLDACVRFEPNIRKPVDGNTAQILRMSWLHRFFFVDGDRSTHLGPFRASAPAATI